MKRCVNGARHLDRGAGRRCLRGRRDGACVRVGEDRLDHCLGLGRAVGVVDDVAIIAARLAMTARRALFAASGTTSQPPRQISEAVNCEFRGPGVADLEPLGSQKPSAYGDDDAGNTTSRDVAGDPSQSLVWDVEGELAQVTTGSATDSYVYSADGDRLVRRQGGSTTVYLPGGMELTATGGTVKATRYYSFNGQVVAVRTGPGTAGVSTLVGDHHGTAGLSIANTTRQVSRRYTDPYGAPRGAVPASWAGDHGFLDKPVDDTGLVSVGARYYDPTTGRFISVDPVMDLADPQQWHGYAYANNNPITWSDPTGLAPQHDGGAPGGRWYRNSYRPARSGLQWPTIYRPAQPAKSVWRTVGAFLSDVKRTVSRLVDYAEAAAERRRENLPQTVWDSANGTAAVEQATATWAIAVQGGELWEDEDGYCGEQAECIIDAEAPMGEDSAITIGHTQLYEMEGAPSPRLVRHEMTHTYDFENFGAAGFLSGYVAYYAGCRRGGLSDSHCYGTDPFEIHAEQHEDESSPAPAGLLSEFVGSLFADPVTGGGGGGGLPRVQAR